MKGWASDAESTGRSGMKYLKMRGRRVDLIKLGGLLNYETVNRSGIVISAWKQELGEGFKGM